MGQRYNSPEFLRDRKKVEEQRKQDNSDFVNGSYDVEFMGKGCKGIVENSVGKDGTPETWISIAPPTGKITMTRPLGDKYDKIDWKNKKKK